MARWVPDENPSRSKPFCPPVTHPRNRTRLEPLAHDHFWLSDTPEVVGSSTWGNANRRMVTWVKFRDLATAKEFYHFNTHLDHEVQTARERGAALIRRRVDEPQ